MHGNHAAQRPAISAGDIHAADMGGLGILRLHEFVCRRKRAPSTLSKLGRCADHPGQSVFASHWGNGLPTSCVCPQAMERRYTALADQQGKLAAEKEKLSSEKHALMEVKADSLHTCLRMMELESPASNLCEVSAGL